ncbi:MAG: hypothetical protein PHO10_08345 [Gemmiger sp.]|nr:hypothetical protein [Gemmiger sp.]
MPKPELYICHTPYQALIALLRAVRGGGGHSLVLAATLPGAAALATRLTISPAFAEVYLVDEGGYPGIAPAGLLQHLQNRRAFERLCGLKLASSKYARIYISNDWSPLGRYLQDKHLFYTLCEDTVGGTLDPDQHLLDEQRAAPDFAERQRTGKGYLYWGDSRWVAAVESEDAARCTIFPPEKLTEFSKAALLQSLTDAEKAAVREVFITQNLPAMGDAADPTLLLPRSFVEDGLLTQPQQDAMFRAVAAHYADGPLFIKAHPRDTTDYHALFPQAVVLDRFMPSEVLNFCLPFRFRRAVAVQSWVLRSFTAAEENVFLTLEEAQALPLPATTQP